MHELLLERLFDILAADPRLYAGGNSYPAGWAGVRRIDNGNSALSNYINLFDEPYDVDSNQARPAIYIGTRNMEVSDRLGFDSISAAGRFEYRQLTIPLILTVQAPTKNAARHARNQLLNNIRQILFDHTLESNYWYDLSLPGEAAGGFAQIKTWATASGASAQNIAEAMATLPVIMLYTYKPGSSA